MNGVLIPKQSSLTGFFQNYATPRTSTWNLEMSVLYRPALAAIERLHVVNVILIYARLAPLSSDADVYSDIFWRRNWENLSCFVRELVRNELQVKPTE